MHDYRSVRALIRWKIMDSAPFTVYDGSFERYEQSSIKKPPRVSSVNNKRRKGGERIFWEEKSTTRKTTKQKICWMRIIFLSSPFWDDWEEKMLGTECFPAPGYVLFLPLRISSLASLRRSTTSRYFSFRSSSSEVSSSWVSCYKIILLNIAGYFGW